MNLDFYVTAFERNLTDAEREAYLAQIRGLLEAGSPEGAGTCKMLATLVPGLCRQALVERGIDMNAFERERW